MIHDNDSMAAHLAVEIEADLLILMTDVDGVYTLPPGKENSLLISTYNPKEYESITYGQKSSVGSGGMQSKVNSALWSLDRGVSCVICNAREPNGIHKIIHGKNIGTFFTHSNQKTPLAGDMAIKSNYRLNFFRHN
jgi:hypothetical protein